MPTNIEYRAPKQLYLNSNRKILLQRAQKEIGKFNKLQLFNYVLERHNNICAEFVSSNTYSKPGEIPIWFDTKFINCFLELILRFGNTNINNSREKIQLDPEFAEMIYGIAWYKKKDSDYIEYKKHLTLDLLFKLSICHPEYFKAVLAEVKLYHEFIRQENIQTNDSFTGLIIYLTEYFRGIKIELNGPEKKLLEIENRNDWSNVSVNMEDFQIESMKILDLSIDKNFERIGAKFEELIWGKIFCNKYLIPQQNLLFNISTFAFLQMYFKIRPEDMNVLAENFEKFLRLRFERKGFSLLKQYSFDKEDKKGKSQKFQLGDIVFEVNKDGKYYLFIGEVKMQKVTLSKCSKPRSLFQQINTHFRSMLFDNENGLFNQRTERLKDFETFYPKNYSKYTKIYNFAFIPSCLDIQEFAFKSKHSNVEQHVTEDKKFWKYFKEECYKDKNYVDVVLVPYSALDSFIEGPLNFCANSKYL